MEEFDKTAETGQNALTPVKSTTFQTIARCVTLGLPLLTVLLTVILTLATPFFSFRVKMMGADLGEEKYSIFKLLFHYEPEDGPKIIAVWKVFMSVVSVIFALSYAVYLLTHIGALNSKTLSVGAFFSAVEVALCSMSTSFSLGLKKRFVGGPQVPGIDIATYSYAWVLLGLWCVLLAGFLVARLFYRDSWACGSKGVKRQNDAFIFGVLTLVGLFFPPMIVGLPLLLFEGLYRLFAVRATCPVHQAQSARRIPVKGNPRMRPLVRRQVRTVLRADSLYRQKDHAGLYGPRRNPYRQRRRLDGIFGRCKVRKIKNKKPLA